MTFLISYNASRSSMCIEKKYAHLPPNSLAPLRCTAASSLATGKINVVLQVQGCQETESRPNRTVPYLRCAAVNFALLVTRGWCWFNFLPALLVMTSTHTHVGRGFFPRTLSRGESIMVTPVGAASTGILWLVCNAACKIRNTLLQNPASRKVRAPKL